MCANNCPKCESMDFNVLKSQSTLFQFSGDRVCNACNAAWRPAVPRWGAVLSLLVGLSIFAPCVVAFVYTFHKFSGEEVRNGGGIPLVPGIFWSFDVYILRRVSTIFAVVGASAILYAVSVLTGRAGSLVIIREGDPLYDAQPVTHGDSQTGMRQSHGRVRWFHIVGGIAFPPFAFIVGLLHLSREKWRSGLLLIGLSVVFTPGFVWIFRWLLST